EQIAETNGDAFYKGKIAEKIAGFAAANGAAMTVDDLASHTADWVEPLKAPFAGTFLHEIPPNGKGIATQMALGMIEALGQADGGPDDADTIHIASEAMKIAFADVFQYVADPAAMRVSPEALLDPVYLASRA